ncbi:MAG: decaprenyl-phosphate phosphoribosyltransferase [Anaerolineae bacterium]|nr:decaprenyl-phosphate phosphoribosyltransferase [Anaerolineae bacterium]
MSQLLGLARTMRLKQWTKNGFVFVPLIFDRKLDDIPYLLATLAGFGLLCLASSIVYLINDIADIEADKAHPTKRLRPLPSGQLSRSTAIIATVALSLLTIPLAFLLKPLYGFVLVGYLLLNLGYSFYLKHLVIIDVMVVAAGYVLRVACGVVLVDVVRFSPWLYIFTTTLALFLGFGKRRHELVLLQGGANNHRAILDQYSIVLLDEMIVIVSATTILTYSLYTFSAEGLPLNHTMMLTIPFVLYGIFRYLYLIHVKGEGGAPDEVILRDHPLQAAVGLWGIAVVIILYVLK